MMLYHSNILLHLSQRNSDACHGQHRRGSLLLLHIVTDISQGSVATCLGCGVLFNDHFITICYSVSVKELPV